MAATAITIPQDIFVGQDFYAPAYRVKVRGKDLLQVESDVLSVTYNEQDNRSKKENEKEMDSFDLTVNNWDPGAGGARSSTVAIDESVSTRARTGSTN